MPDNQKNKPQKKEHDHPTSEPDPETLGKTDPQDNMKGPISSAVNKVKESIEKEGDKDVIPDKED